MLKKKSKKRRFVYHHESVFSDNMIAIVELIGSEKAYQLFFEYRHDDRLYIPFLLTGGRFNEDSKNVQRLLRTIGEPALRQLNQYFIGGMIRLNTRRFFWALQAEKVLECHRQGLYIYDIATLFGLDLALIKQIFVQYKHRYELRPFLPYYPDYDTSTASTVMQLQLDLVG